MVLRLVDYVAVLELAFNSDDLDRDDEDRRNDNPAEGRIVQRFPKEDWEGHELQTDGLLMFCQPNGWRTYPYPRPPEVCNFTFTKADAKYTYISCLSVFEQCSNLIDGQDAIDVDEELTPSFFYRSDSKRASLSASCPDLPQTLYAPKCICIVSSFPFFSTFKECLCEIYSRYIEDGSAMSEAKAMEGVENIIATLLSTVVPDPMVIERPLVLNLDGRSITVAKTNLASQPPFTGTSIYNLVSTIGIGHTLKLVASMITDHKILFISSNYSSLLAAAQAAQWLIYPLTVKHYSYIPVLPNTLLAVIDSPVPYLAGIHVSSLQSILPSTPAEEEIFRTVLVDLDNGTLTIPSSIENEIPPLPMQFRKYLTHCLKLILDPKYLVSDLAYAPTIRTISPPIVQDKEIRAVFMQFFAWLLAQYRCCLMIVRTHPRPVIVFNEQRFLEIRSFQNEQIVLKLFETMSWSHFVDEYGPPYRVATLFDELVKSVSDKPPRVNASQDQRLPVDVRELTLKLLENERQDTSVNPYTKPPDNLDDLKFPYLREYRIAELMEENDATQKPTSPVLQEPMSIIRDRPLPPEIQPARTVRSKQKLRKMNNDLQNCLTAMFSQQIFLARKLLNKAVVALNESTIRNSFVAELTAIPNSKTSLTPAQFDILSVLINTSLENDRGVDAGDFAIKIMPLTDKFCRQLGYGTVQFMYTIVQHHTIWQSVAFWERAFYCVVQQHILEVFETMEKEGHLTLKRTASEALRNGYFEDGKPVQSMSEISQRALIHSALRMLSSGAWNEETHKEVKEQEETTIIGQVRHFCSRIIWLLVPLEEEIELMDIYDLNSAKEPRRSFEKRDIIELVERFIDHIVGKCDVKHYSEIDRIRSCVPEMLNMHCDTIAEVSQLAVKLPPVKKTTFLKARMEVPPLVHLEKMQVDPVHVYMMPVPAETGSKVVQPQILPAEGVLYLTNYRVIFIGFPRNSDDENTIIYRCIPVGSIYTMDNNEERAFSPASVSEDFDLPDEDEDCLDVEQQLQICSLTCQIFRIGFFNERSSDGIEQFKKKLVRLRTVNKIVQTFAFVRPDPEPLEMAGGAVVAGTVGPAAGSGGVVSTATKKSYRKSMMMLPQKQPSVSSKKKDSESGGGPKSPPGHMDQPCPPPPGVLTHSPSMHSLNSNGGMGDEHSENISLASGLTATSFFHGSFRVKRPKKRPILRCRPEYTYCEDFARLGFGGFNDIGKSSSKNAWRLTAFNKDYTLCRSYPAILVVPSLATDISLHDISRQFERSRFPVMTWKHPRRPATILMRSAAIVKKGRLEAVNWKLRVAAHNRTSTDLPDTGFRSEHTENYLNGLVHAIKQLQANCKTTAYHIGKSKNHHIQKFLFRGMTKLRETMTMSSDKLFQSSYATGSQATLSHIPEGEDLLQEDDEENRKITLFVIGSYHDLQNARMENYNEVEFIGINDNIHYRYVARAYELLMATLYPNDNINFWEQIENSNWLEHVQKILEISVAVVTLMDKFGVSVLLALEDGSNFTAQISSLIQLLSDKEYRTTKGFIMLLEKEWLSFGHRFSHHGRQTNEKEDCFSPIFLQFLDCVYQIHRQFPHCFEFNEFFLECLAYHHCSMRFRTFVCDSEKKRCNAVGVCRSEDDSRASTPIPVRKSSIASISNEGTSSSDDSTSFWTYVENLKKSSPIFYNYFYKADHGAVLRPNIHMASLELWRYYTRGDLTEGPAYEPDLWAVKQDINKKSVPATPKDQIREGLGYTLISLTECTLNRAVTDGQIDSPWLQVYLSRNIDIHYKPSNTALTLTNKTLLRRKVQPTNVKCLTEGKVRVTGHRFEEYTYNPFTEPERLPCIICEGNPDVPSKAQLTINGLKCFYCQTVIHKMCQLFINTSCKKRELQAEVEPIARSNTLRGNQNSGGGNTATLTRLRGSMSRSATNPELSDSSRSSKTIIDNQTAAALATSGVVVTVPSSPRRNGRSATEEGNIEATLLKKGGLLKTWRKWRFELNVKLKELRYYESASDAHNPMYIRKTIDLRGRIKVVPLAISTTNGHHHQYPFSINTERKNLVLAADTKELRDIWMKKIKGVSD